VEYFWLWIAQVVSAFGDWIGFFAITALAATLAEHPEAAVALVLTARVAPSVVLAPVIGVLIDRFDRRRLMVVADICRALVFCALPFVRTVQGLVIASLLLEIFTLVWGPSKEALVPSLVPTEKLATANSLGLVAAYGTMPIAGLMQYGLKTANDALANVSWLQPLQFNARLGETQALAFYVDALSFVITALIVIVFVRPKIRSTVTSTSTSTSTSGSADARIVNDQTSDTSVEPSLEGSTAARVREGWKYIASTPVIRSVHVGLGAGLLGGAMLIPLGPIFAKDVLGSADAFPLFITALGVGVAIGVSAVSAFQDRLPKASVFAVALLVAGAALFLGVSMSSFWPAALWVGLLGVCAGTVYVLGYTLLHEQTTDELRGRTFSTLLVLVRMCVLLALWLGPVIAALIDGFVRSALHTRRGAVPTTKILGLDMVVSGARITLWLSAVVITVAGVATARSLSVGLRAVVGDALAATHRDQVGKGP
jgi:dTMP kinase